MGFTGAGEGPGVAVFFSLKTYLQQNQRGVPRLLAAIASSTSVCASLGSCLFAHNELKRRDFMTPRFWSAVCGAVATATMAAPTVVDDAVDICGDVVDAAVDAAGFVAVFAAAVATGNAAAVAGTHTATS